jgi:hypothetical protein
VRLWLHVYPLCSAFAHIHTCSPKTCCFVLVNTAWSGVFGISPGDTDLSPHTQQRLSNAQQRLLNARRWHVSHANGQWRHLQPTEACTYRSTRDACRLPHSGGRVPVKLLYDRSLHKHRNKCRTRCAASVGTPDDSREPDAAPAESWCGTNSRWGASRRAAAAVGGYGKKIQELNKKVEDQTTPGDLHRWFFLPNLQKCDPPSNLEWLQGAGISGIVAKNMSNAGCCVR